MKKLLLLLVVVCICGIIYINKDSVINFILSNFIDEGEVVFGSSNDYYKDYDYAFVQNTDNLYPSNRQDILNIIYSTLNRGLDTTTFYCDDSYTECIDDVNDIAENSLYLSTINNLVHPFNSYSNIHFTINNYGNVVLKINKVYSEADALLVSKRVDDIISSIIDDKMSDYDKILAFHDYIVNNTSYDSSVSIESQMNVSTNSNNAIGLLFNGKAICSGYSDAMAIFLSKLGYNNYKISSDLHIWNLVYIDGEWKHIDATWDDPVTANGENVLLHDFFLIDTNTLFSKENSYEMDNHNFDRNLYIEAN